MSEKYVKVTPYGTLTFQSFPTCPECGAPWENDHRDGGHCPGRPQGCTCRCEMRHHREPHGCVFRPFGAPCTCVYLRRPVNWATHDGDYSSARWGR